MKRTRFCSFFRVVSFVAMLFIGIAASAQQITVSGVVTDGAGEPVIGASIAEVGSTNGTMTDFNGNFSLKNVQSNGTLQVSFIGYTTQTIPVNGKTVINVTLQDNAVQLQEVIAIGYGTVKKSDATGSMAVLSAADMNKGAIVTADNLITGRIAGVQLVPNGNPGTGSQIRIRGGASLDASNDPLIVVDGLPLENASISQINPNDIQTFSVLKDASATAIYGSRASNGVILITTKKGGEGKWQFNVDAQGGANTLPYTISTLSQKDFIKSVTALGESSAAMLGLNGKMYDTDWQKEIYSNKGFASANISARGNIAGVLPSRFTVGYNNTPGLLNTSGYERTNLSAVFNPTFFNKTLKVDVNLNGSFENYNKADEGAIAGAIFADPTKPVYDNASPYRTKDGKKGYFEWGSGVDVDGNYLYNMLSGRNPVSLLDEVDHTSDVRKFWGNVQLDYAIPYAKGLRAVANFGLQYEKWFEDCITNKTASTIFAVKDPVTDITTVKPVGGEWHNNGHSSNQLMDLYLNYLNTFGLAKTDITAGYSYQKMNVGGEYNSADIIKHALNSVVEVPKDKLYTEKVMISFFGRANVTLADKYLFTFTVRNDRSSFFSKKYRSGIFPAASFAWRVIDEDFFKNKNTISDLKLRVGWGITGQQNLYPGEKINLIRYLPMYSLGTDASSQYPIGDDSTYPVFPLAYNPKLKWEETSTYNAGIDFGFAKNRLTGSLDVYYKESKDLLADVQIPVGSNFSNQMWMNIGSFSTKGVELGLNYDLFRSAKAGAFKWDISYNISVNKIEITDYPPIASNARSGLQGANGYMTEIHQKGYAPFSYFVYQQVYDSNNKPVEGVFADRNGDGKLDENDRYIYHHPNPDATMGLATNMSFKNFDFSMAWRASVGNYIFNNIKAINSYGKMLNPSGSYLKNVVSAKYQEQNDYKVLSDQWVENGSFLKWDNATIGYSISNVLGNGTRLRVYGSVQNILCLTKADVNDPEVAIGGDAAGLVWNLYPRPRTYMIGVSLNF